MGLFNFGKKKEEAKESTCACNAPVDEVKEDKCCCCGGNETQSSCCEDNVGTQEGTCCSEVVDGICCIKVLGAGCKSCHEQYEYAKEAVSNLGLNVEVEYITDMEKVMTYGVMSMPAIVVNEKVVSMGKVLKSADVEKLLHKLGF